MTSQEGMANLSRAVSNLSQAMDLMVEHQQEYDALALLHDEKIRTIDEEIRNIRLRMGENTARIRELIAAANRMQAEIARLDSASQ